MRWTPDAIEHLRDLVESGMAHAEIAEKFGVTLMAIQSATARYKIRALITQKRVMSGCDRDALLTEIRRLAETGASSSMIAEVIGKTKNAVIGICRRNGIKLEGHKHSVPPPARPKPPERTVAMRPRVQKAEFQEPGIGVDTSGRPTLIEAGPGQCRYPLWQGRVRHTDAFVCGEPVHIGTSYCPDCFVRTRARQALPAIKPPPDYSVRSSRAASKADRVFGRMEAFA